MDFTVFSLNNLPSLTPPIRGGNFFA